MRESYKLAPKSADGKVAMRSAGNTVSKRISKCLLKWFGCTYCSELPRDVNELRDPMADDFAGVLRSYCEPDNLEAIDYDEARRAAGVRPADQMDTVPDSCERGFLVPAGSQKKRSQAHLDDRVSDDDDNDGVASKPEKKRACGKKRVRTDEADEAGPSSKRQRHPSMPTSCSGMEGLVDPGLQQLPQQLLQYPTQHPQREQPQDIAALYGMPVHNRQRAAYLPNVTPGHPEVDYGTFDPALDGLGAAVVPEMMPSTNNASNNAQQMANGTSGMVTINAENRMPGHFTDLEVYMQQMMMRQLGPIHDDQGQLVTDWGRYAMRIIDRNFGFRFF